MIILYLDSYIHGNVATCAGFAVREREPYFMAKTLEKTVKSILGEDEGHFDLSVRHIVNGKHHGKRLSPGIQVRLMKECLGKIADRRKLTVLASSKQLANRSENEVACDMFRDIVKQFAAFLERTRASRTKRYPEKGMMICAQSPREKFHQTMVNQLRYQEEKRNVLRNIAEVPAFMNPRSSVMVQVSSLLSYAIHQHVANSSDELFDIISPKLFHGTRHRA